MNKFELAYNLYFYNGNIIKPWVESDNINFNSETGVYICPKDGEYYIDSYINSEGGPLLFLNEIPIASFDVNGILKRYVNCKKGDRLHLGMYAGMSGKTIFKSKTYLFINNI